jgi:hypothetical protein
MQSADQTVQEQLTALPSIKKWLKKAYVPFAGGYKPEIGESPEVAPIKAKFFQSHIGILHWYLELGCIALVAEVSILSTYLWLPHEGHLMCHICIDGSCHTVA